jgi:hypothetical protein
VADRRASAEGPDWLRVAQGFGGIYVVGQLWIASVDTQADAQVVQSAIGGTIH